MAGEPIILHYKIQNTTDDKWVETRFDEYSDLWYTLKLFDKNGEPVAPIPDRHHLRHYGVFAMNSPIFRPRVTQEGDIVVNQVFRVAQAGDYRLRIDINMPYVEMGHEYDASAVNTPRPEASSTIVRTEVTVHLNVSSADPAKLAAEAESLRAAYMATQERNARDRILESLCALPEANAADSWRKLALDPNLTQPMKIAEALAQTQTLSAVDILIEMQQKAPPMDRGGGSNSPLLLVKRIYEVSPRETKGRIDEELRRYHANLNIPDISD